MIRRGQLATGFNFASLQTPHLLLSPAAALPICSILVQTTWCWAEAVAARVSKTTKGHALLVEGQVAQGLPPTSIFGSLKEASDFFERGSLGYSGTVKPDQFDGLELRSFNWQVQPLAVDRWNRAFSRIGPCFRLAP
jgi:hypothetical protein